MKAAYRKWTAQEIEYLAKVYPQHSNAYISQFLHRTPRAVQQKARQIGVRKDPEYCSATRAKNQFKTGHAAYNKNRKRGTYMSEESQRKCAATQFKSGECRASNPCYRQASYEMLRSADKTGRRYWWIKPADGRRMMPKHRWLWEQAHGPIPKGWCVQFLDGDTTNCVIDNLYLISRAKQVRKNFDDLPEERKRETWAKMTESRLKSIKRDRILLRWGLEPKGRFIKRMN